MNISTKMEKQQKKKIYVYIESELEYRTCKKCDRRQNVKSTNKQK